MCCRGMSYLPLMLVILAASTFVLTYIIAVVNNDVSPDFPYISDTGTTPPESCIFSQFLNMCATLCLCTIYVRYKLVEVLANTAEDSKSRNFNKAGFVLGIFTALGLSLVANFQAWFVGNLTNHRLGGRRSVAWWLGMCFAPVAGAFFETNVEPVHVTGAMLVFGVGVIYAMIQTALTYHMHPDFNGLYICRVRLTLTIISFFVMVITIASSVICRMQKLPTTDKLHWKSDEPGFAAHLVSTVGEWMTALTFLCYFLTFVRDFMKLKLEVKPQIYVRHLDEEPTYPGEYTRLLA